MKKRELLDYARPHYTEDQLLDLDHAIDVATEAHKNQKRKSGEPYIIHPLNVAHTLIDWGMDIDSVIAGVLHDVIEDTDLTKNYIENLFGADIAFLVDGVTKVGRARAGMRSLEDYRPQTTDNLSKLLIAVGEDIRVIIIKLADRLHNLQTLNHMSKEKQQKIARESLQVFAPIADQLGMGRLRQDIEELAFSYLNPKEYNRLQKEMRKRLGRSTRKLGKVREEVEKELASHHIDYEVNGRVKGIYSLHKKLKKVHDNIDDIYDLMALRVIVNRKEDCYQVLGILHSMYQPMINRIKDYIAIPKPNGYQSLHTTVVTPDKQIVEFQIRTHDMHIYAESGLAASFHYHAQKDSKIYREKRESVLTSLPKNLQWITQLQEVASRLQNGAEISPDQLAIDLFSDRIFVYSPKGDIYNLPEGALPLDFAYLVHSDIAKHAFGFKVNGKIHPFDKPLQNGVVVEVLTKKSANPKPDWQDLVKTSHAKAKLRLQLKRSGFFEHISSATSAIQRKARERFKK